MRHAPVTLTLSLVVLLSPTVLLAQSPQQSQSTSMSVPRLIRLTGTFRPADGQTPLSVETVTVAIYAEETGGAPLWQETQKLAIDAEGRYALLLGAGQPEGVPHDVFASGEPRWMGMVWNRPGEIESARWRATSVPYALRAGDAETLGGKPAAAYALASPADGRERTTTRDGAPIEGLVIPAAVLPGTTNFLAKYVNGVDVGSSNVYETAGLVGINTSVPFDALHSRFINTTGTMTGIAVQNLGSTATSYSGMLFYDHTGALGQFQGFNNLTKEYRINNIATGGTINFMIGSMSRFRVLNNGRLAVNTLGTISGDTTGSRGQSNGWIPPGASAAGGVWIEGGSDESGGFYADSQTAAIWSPGDADVLRVYDEDDLSPGSTGVPIFVVTSPGNIRVGTGVNGCVFDADGTIIAGTCSSDERLKKDIRQFDGNMLDRLLKLRPVYYRWREELTSKNVGPNPGEAYGLIAQEVEKIYPEMVGTDRDGYKTVDYGKLQYVLLGALKEEHAKVEGLDAKVADLEQRLARLEAATTAGWGPTAGLLFGGLGVAGFTLRRRSSRSAAKNA